MVGPHTGRGGRIMPLSSVSDASLSGVRDWEKVLTLPLVSEALCPSRLRHRVERKKSPAVVLGARCWRPARNWRTAAAEGR